MAYYVHCPASAPKLLGRISAQFSPTPAQTHALVFRVVPMFFPAIKAKVSGFMGNRSLQGWGETQMPLSGKPKPSKGASSWKQ